MRATAYAALCMLLMELHRDRNHAALAALRESLAPCLSGQELRVYQALDVLAPRAIARGVLWDKVETSAAAAAPATAPATKEGEGDDR